MIDRLEIRFVASIPEIIDKGVLYISIRFRTTSHLCACGCGERVVAKLSPNDWSVLYNGRDLTLTPSIGNWTFECRSHYFVRKNRIVWAGEMSDQQIIRGRELNAQRKKVVSITKSQLTVEDKLLTIHSNTQGARPDQRTKKASILVRLRRWIFNSQ